MVGTAIRHSTRCAGRRGRKRLVLCRIAVPPTAAQTVSWSFPIPSDTKTQLPTICKRHFQMYFLESEFGLKFHLRLLLSSSDKPLSAKKWWHSLPTYILGLDELNYLWQYDTNYGWHTMNSDHPIYACRYLYPWYRVGVICYFSQYYRVQYKVDVRICTYAHVYILYCILLCP